MFRKKEVNNSLILLHCSMVGGTDVDGLIRILLLIYLDIDFSNSTDVSHENNKAER